MNIKEIFEKLKEKFGDEVKYHEKTVGDSFIEVTPLKIKQVCEYLKKDEELAFDYLKCLSGVDYPPDKMAVSYHIFSYKYRHLVFLKVFLPRDNPSLPSIENIWKAANWHEREVFDLFGVIFEDHSDLRRLLCPNDWIGHTLRKDYIEQPEYNGMSTKREYPT